MNCWAIHNREMKVLQYVVDGCAGYPIVAEEQLTL